MNSRVLSCYPRIASVPLCRTSHSHVGADAELVCRHEVAAFVVALENISVVHVFLLQTKKKLLSPTGNESHTRDHVHTVQT